MSRLRLLFLALLAIAAFLIGSFAVDAWFVAPGPEAEARAFLIERGEGTRAIAERLAEDDVVASARGFLAYVRFFGGGKAIQAGVFDLSTHMSYAAALEALSDGRAPEAQVTIPEGFTLAQIGAAVREKIPGVTEEAWAAAVGNDSPLEAHAFVAAAGKPDGVDLEGYLFPDTYRFLASASAEDVAKRMLDTMAVRFEEVGFTPSRELPNAHAFLTLASVVEREVRRADEMANVADIFLKRLKIGMALQADSTVNYVTGGNDPGVSYADTQIDSLYNTYKYPGLPPGAIASPGRNALRAVATPRANAWYYFLTDAEGSVYYATTYEQHLQNVRTHLR